MKKLFGFILLAVTLAACAFADIPAAEKAASNELGALAGRTPLYSVENGHVGVVDLHDANLTKLPESIGNLSGLYLLNLSFNKITALPASFGNLKNLKWLYLGNNGLTSLPESFGNLTALRTLELGDNNLTALPASITKLKTNTWDKDSPDLRKNKLPVTELQKLLSDDAAKKQAKKQRK